MVVAGRRGRVIHRGTWVIVGCIPRLRKWAITLGCNDIQLEFICSRRGNCTRVVARVGKPSPVKKVQDNGQDNNNGGCKNASKRSSRKSKCIRYWTQWLGTKS